MANNRYHLIKNTRFVLTTQNHNDLVYEAVDELVIVDSLKNNEAVYTMNKNSNIHPVNVHMTCVKMNDEYYSYQKQVMNYILWS